MSASNFSAKAAESAALDADVVIIGGGPGGLATAAAVLSAFGQHVCVKVSSRNRNAVASNRVPLTTNAFSNDVRGDTFTDYETRRIGFAYKMVSSNTAGLREYERVHTSGFSGGAGCKCSACFGGCTP